MTEQPNYLIAALYHFAPLPDPEARVERYRAEAAARDLSGTLLVAPEGVNGTLAGAPEKLRGFLALLRQDPLLAGLEHKESTSTEPPFRRLRVRLKREIVSMGAPGVVSDQSVAAYTSYDRWNELIREPGVMVIDVRNSYEIAIGKFEGAIDPETDSFREFPAWAEANYERMRQAPAVAIYCTGGIRCEKAGAFLRDMGIDRLFQLKGGILKYLEHAPEQESAWEGGCFVFDERVSVGHGLEVLDHSLCRGCRRPLTDADRASPLYREGVACPHCANEADAEQKRRREERQKQMELAAKRGAAHMANTPSPAVATPARYGRDRS
ncbi:MAG: rhodanese-related sulfurtransferase [Neomegalonema sp.]|nr:rhodanese-related sulfurtransferase [Neomegalonema sp.]